MNKTNKFLEKSSHKNYSISKPANPRKNLKATQQTKTNPAKDLAKRKHLDKNPSGKTSSFNKENTSTKLFETPLFSKQNLSIQITLKKKPPKKSKLKNSMRGTSSLFQAKANKSLSPFSPILMQSVSTLPPDTTKRITPRSNPSPMFSHRTPDTSKSFYPGQKLTEKKTKIPEVGFYCKRVSLYEKSRLSLNPFEKEEISKLSFNSPLKTIENPAETFESPKQLIKVYSSPDRKPVTRREAQPKTPRKTVPDFDSPGSFYLSLSSSSSDEKLKKMSENKKDEESQTEMIDFISDSRIIEGLKLIGRLSEIMTSK